MNDLAIRGATVYDGSGAPGRVVDVAVKDGRFAPPGPARETLDAGGLALMPGIVDVHTHYDAQVTWDPTLSPSVSLGVTTAVMGNCGFGIAPCPAQLADGPRQRHDQQDERRDRARQRQSRTTTDAAHQPAEPRTDRRLAAGLDATGDLGETVAHEDRGLGPARRVGGVLPGPGRGGMSFCSA